MSNEKKHASHSSYPTVGTNEARMKGGPSNKPHENGAREGEETKSYDEITHRLKSSKT
jgi:hypothetical protein